MCIFFYWISFYVVIYIKCYSHRALKIRSGRRLMRTTAHQCTLRYAFCNLELRMNYFEDFWCTTIFASLHWILDYSWISFIHSVSTVVPRHKILVFVMYSKPQSWKFNYQGNCFGSCGASWFAFLNWMFVVFDSKLNCQLQWTANRFKYFHATRTQIL